jgi:hypothetical protein
MSGQPFQFVRVDFNPTGDHLDLASTEFKLTTQSNGSLSLFTIHDGRGSPDSIYSREMAKDLNLQPGEKILRVDGNPHRDLLGGHLGNSFTLYKVTTILADGRLRLYTIKDGGSAPNSFYTTEIAPGQSIPSDEKILRVDFNPINDRFGGHIGNSSTQYKITTLSPNGEIELYTIRDNNVNPFSVMSVSPKQLIDANERILRVDFNPNDDVLRGHLGNSFVLYKITALLPDGRIKLYTIHDKGSDANTVDVKLEASNIIAPTERILRVDFNPIQDRRGGTLDERCSVYKVTVLTPDGGIKLYTVHDRGAQSNTFYSTVWAEKLMTRPGENILRIDFNSDDSYLDDKYSVYKILTALPDGTLTLYSINARRKVNVKSIGKVHI